LEVTKDWAKFGGNFYDHMTGKKLKLEGNLKAAFLVVNDIRDCIERVEYFAWIAEIEASQPKVDYEFT